MNKRQKEVLQQFLDNEKDVLKKLEDIYKDALAEINTKVELLLARQDADLQHVIYQVEYQKSLKLQVQAILEQLQNNEFETLSEFLTGAYEDGFVGAMYDMQGQGVPLVFPIDQEQIVRAIQKETKLSEGLYAALGKDTKELSKKIASEISRGIATGAMYPEIARNIASQAKIPKNRAMVIARTEAHRIQCAATANAQWKAKEKGADVVKVWDSYLDGLTRPTHRELDGQVRELDEPFKVAGKKAMYPGDFGDPAEDCNCRCALLQTARWALGDDIQKWVDGELVTIKAKDYDSFKKEYFKKVDEANSVRQGTQKMKAEKEYAENERIRKGMKYAVDTKVIESREYIDKFNNMTDDADEKREFLKNAKTILKHRSGQNGEDLYLYNSKTKRWYKSTTGTQAGTPEYTQEIMDGIIGANAGELVAFHNHPASMPPSVDDINTALQNRYKKGYALCHDGKIFEYTASDIYINESIYNLRIADYEGKGYNQFDAQIETMKYLSNLYGFTFKEVE